MRPFLSLLILLLSGCVIIDKTDQLQAQIDRANLERIAGVYFTKGASPKGLVGPNLAEVIFPSHPQASEAEMIRVYLPQPDIVKCEAIKGDAVLFSKQFLAGVDFKIESGIIPLGKRLDDLGMGEPGAMHVGVGSVSRELRFLTNGNLVLREKGSAVGVFMFGVPFAAVTEGDIIYERKKD